METQSQNANSHPAPHPPRPEGGREVSSQSGLVVAFDKACDGTGTFCISIFFIIVTIGFAFLIVIGCWMLATQENIRYQVFNWIGGIFIGLMTKAGWLNFSNKN